MHLNDHKLGAANTVVNQQRAEHNARMRIWLEGQDPRV